MASGCKIVCNYEPSTMWSWPNPLNWGAIIGDGLTTGWLYEFFNTAGVTEAMPVGGPLIPTATISYVGATLTEGPLLRVTLYYDSLFPQQTDMATLESLVSSAALAAAGDLAAFDTLSGIDVVNSYVEAWNNDATPSL